MLHIVHFLSTDIDDLKMKRLSFSRVQFGDVCFHCVYSLRYDVSSHPQSVFLCCNLILTLFPFSCLICCFMK